MQDSFHSVCEFYVYGAPLYIDDHDNYTDFIGNSNTVEDFIYYGDQQPAENLGGNHGQHDVSTSMEISDDDKVNLTWDNWYYSYDMLANENTSRNGFMNYRRSLAAALIGEINDQTVVSRIAAATWHVASPATKARFKRP
jgi:hypothetical protein